MIPTIVLLVTLVGSASARSPILHPKCSTWADKFETCLEEGYRPTRFPGCEIGDKKSRQPYCTRFERYLASGRCPYQCPKSVSDCDYSYLRCSMDANCETKLHVYQQECEVMRERNLTSCTESCFKAYHNLRMDKYGRVLVEQQCDGLGVKNVKYSCIKQPASRQCLQSVSRCSDHCRYLAREVSEKCLVGFEDAVCSPECRDAYLTILEDESSAELRQDCHDVSTVISVKCDVYA